MTIADALLPFAVRRPLEGTAGASGARPVAERCSGQCKARRRALIQMWLGMAYQGYQQDCTLLGLNANEPITEDILAKAFRNRALAFHPDKFPDGAEKRAKTLAFQQLGAAKERLRGAIGRMPAPAAKASTSHHQSSPGNTAAPPSAKASPAAKASSEAKAAPPAPAPPPPPPPPPMPEAASKAPPPTTKAPPETKAAPQAAKAAPQAQQAYPPPLAPCGASHRLVKKGTQGNATYMYYSAAVAGCLQCVRYWVETERVPPDARSENQGYTAIDYIAWSQHGTARLAAPRPDTTEVEAYLRELA